MKRREVLQNLAVTPLLFGTGQMDSIKKSGKRIQYSINAYSFNTELRSGAMTFYDLMEFAAEIGLDAVDITGYYFESYPSPPSEKELFSLKKKALELGLNISWTGIRNDFVNPDAISREADRALIEKWLETSSKLGSSIMRIFSGTHKHEGYSKDEVKKWLVEEFKLCAQYAEKTGVLIGLQHHNDFLYTSDEVIDILKRVDSEWFGLILDVGSLHSANPYDEIEKLAPYANYWFIKEHVNPNGKATPVDMKKIASILKKEGYQGYISFESLSDGDGKKIVNEMFDSFREGYNQV
jgi:sugar phosphate isomerase/epimerase